MSIEPAANSRAAMRARAAKRTGGGVATGRAPHPENLPEDDRLAARLRAVAKIERVRNEAIAEGMALLSRTQILREKAHGRGEARGNLGSMGEINR